jgi:HD superfamily phosphohydrolase
MDIRDPIHGTIEVTPAEVAVLDCYAFQRLRAIKQLGFAEFSFPGATHNRYIHSLGVCHLAGVAFDQIFRGYQFTHPEVRWRLRQTTRLAALLHDIGHGPLSHTTEEVMPQLSELDVKVYKDVADRKATHEDYTIRYLTDSSLTQVLQEHFKDLSPLHIACLIDRHLPAPDDFFIDGDRNFRPILSQIVSSELDVDRMDYLERDAFFCGTNYGKVELSWLMSNLTSHEVDGQMHLALSRRALYTFDDFLISRHHMYLMVYFHHKSIIYEEMLTRYLSSPDCQFKLPADIEEYTRYNDYALYEHLATVSNPWARRIVERKPFRVLLELHATAETQRPEKARQALAAEGIDVILSSSRARLSKYHSDTVNDNTNTIYVVDPYDRLQAPVPIQDTTEIFEKYEETRRIERLYVAPEQYTHAAQLVQDRRL